jgi:GntR family transcriptional regulator/MocR family aminotransferase
MCVYIVGPMAVDLFLVGVPVRRRSAALFEQLRHAIVTGRLRPGDRLPTSRDLAAELGLSRSTVTGVYGRLVAEGFAEGRTGDGTFVAAGAAPFGRRQPGRSARQRRSPMLRAPTPPTPLSSGWAVDLRSVRADPARFPLAEWRRCVSAALQRPPPAYGDAAGLPALRRALAAWVRRARGVQASAENVVITAGAQGAFDLCARVLLSGRDVVAFENPGYARARRAFEQHGRRVAPVLVDEDGMDVSSIPLRTRGVYVTPSHQLPTGAVLSAQRRRDLLRFADRADALVFEDDYDTEYRYVDRPLEPLQRLDSAGRVVYIGGFSKTLSPSLRVGFVIAPVEHVEALTTGRVLVDGEPPHLVQAALAELIARGNFERHVRRSRRIYRERRDVVLAHLGRFHDAGLIAQRPTCNAGLHVTLELPDHVDASVVAAHLSRRGIAVDTTDGNWVGAHPPGLVIGFGLATREQLDQAIGELQVVLTQAVDVDPRLSR